MIGIVQVASRPEWVEEFQQSCDMLECPWRLVRMDREDWESQIDDLSLVLWRAHQGDQKELQTAKKRIPIVENMGTHCFPSASMISYYDDKALQSQFFRERHIRTPKTKVSNDSEELLEFLQKASYPLVVKTPSGASSKNVHLIRSAKEGKKLVHVAFGKLLHPPWAGRRQWKAFRKTKPIIFQEYIPSDGDWRITTFGNNVVSVFKRANRPGDFRASGSGIWKDVSSDEVPMAICCSLLELGREEQFTSMAYDLVKQGDKWFVLEMSYTFLLSRIYTDTLFRITNNEAKEISPVRVGVLHLCAMREIIGDETWKGNVMKG